MLQRAASLAIVVVLPAPVGPTTAVMPPVMQVRSFITGKCLTSSASGMCEGFCKLVRRGVIAASQGGKLKTLLQIIAICLYVLPPSFGLPALIKEVVMGAALVVTLVTGVDYVVRAVRLIQKPT